MSRWVLWVVIGGSILAGFVLGGATIRQRLQGEESPCEGGQYGVDYETCVGCIQNENYCASVWKSPGEEHVTPVPTVSAPPEMEPLSFCRQNPYGTDYMTCIECIQSASHCASAWRTPSARPALRAATPTPTPTSTQKPSSATPTPTPTATPSPTPTSTPSPTPAYDCDGGYGGSYDECISCGVVSQSYCESLFR